MKKILLSLFIVALLSFPLLIFADNYITEAMTYQNGNMSYGTTVPAEKLEVIGNIKATSFKGNGSELTGISGGIPSGMITFIVSGTCPSGTVSQPTFTGTQFDNRSAFTKVICCKKD